MEELPKEVQLLVDSMTSNMIQLKDLTPAIWLNLVIQAIKRAEALDVQSVLELGDHRLAG